MRPTRLMTLFTLVTASATASAQQQQQDPRFWSPPADDSSLGILREVFGNVVDFVVGNGGADLGANDTVIGAGFEVFNTAVLFLGMIFVAYSTIMAVVNTAHDGEFLGKKMSSIWVPLRTVGGSALLLPLAGGFSLIQILVMWLGVQGVGIADRAWTAMLERVDQTGMVNHAYIPNARPLVANILRFEVCRQAMNKQYAEAERSDRIVVKETRGAIASMVPTDRIDSGMGTTTPAAFGVNYAPMSIPTVTYSWSATDGSYMRPDVCGSITWEESPESQKGNARYLDVRSIHSAHSAAVKDVIAAMSPIAKQIVEGNKPNSDAIMQAAYQYENRIRAASRTAVTNANNASKNAFVDYAKTGGWVNAGAYYNHIISLNDAVQLSVNSLPTSKASDISEKESADTLVGYADAMAVTEEFLKERSHATHAAYKDELRLDVNACSEPLPSTWEDIRKCLSQPSLIGIEMITQNMAGSNTSHVSQVKAIGDIIMAVAWTNVGALAIAGGLADAKGVDWTIGVVFSLKGALSQVGFMINAASLALLAAGAMMAFYIPMIPFISWISGIIKWVVSVAEAMVAAPIFAAAHIHPDGDDAVGRAGPGYMLILSVVTRPILMLFGLILSIGVAQPISHLVNGGFMLATKGAMHDSANGLGALVAFAVIYGIIQTTVLHAVFSLINYIPDATFRWMGSAVGMHGIADSEARESQSVFAGAASHTRTMMPHGGGGGGGKAGPSPGGGGSGGNGGGQDGGPSTSHNDHAQTAPATAPTRDGSN